MINKTCKSLFFKGVSARCQEYCLFMLLVLAQVFLGAVLISLLFVQETLVDKVAST